MSRTHMSRIHCVYQLHIQWASQTRTCVTQINTECMWMPTIYVTNAYVTNSYVTNSLCIPIAYTMGITDSHVCDPDKYFVHMNADDIADIFHELILVTNSYMTRTHIRHELIMHTHCIYTGSYVCDPDKHWVHTNADDVADIWNELIYDTNSIRHKLIMHTHCIYTGSYVADICNELMYVTNSYMTRYHMSRIHYAYPLLARTCAILTGI